MNPEMERLLGGYATDTLSDAEKKLLFEAALEDQELFNALQDEQALRELLADGASRQAIQQALEAPRPFRRFAAPWRWPLVVGLAAACLLSVVVVRWDMSPPPRIVQNEVALVQRDAISRVPETPKTAEPAAAAPRIVHKQKAIGPIAKKQEPARSVGQLFAPAAPAPAPMAAPMPQTSAQLGTGNAGFVGGVVRMPLFPLVVLRRDRDGSYSEVAAGDVIQAGDWLRFEVRPQSVGTLAISRRTDTGEWKSLPADAPIQVNGEVKLRLQLMTPAAAPAMEIELAPGKPVIRNPAP